MRSVVLLLLLASLANAAPLRGNVLVPAGVPLHATAAAARADAGAPGNGAPVAMRVIREHAGDVVELTTAPTEDCIDSGDGSYALTVFVKRDKLYRRTGVEIVKTFPDGTAIAIDRGAPVTSTGVWLEDAFNAMKIAPDKLVHAVPATQRSAALPALAGEPLACDGGGPISVAEYRARRAKQREATRDADQREAEARARQRAEERRHKRELQRAEILRERAKRKGKRTPEQKMEDDMVDLLLADDSPSMTDMLDRDSMSDRVDMPPPCHVAGVKALVNHRVVKSGNRYLADLGYRCGRVRVLVDHAQIGGSGAGLAIGGGGGRLRTKVWIPKAGPVTWASGKPAGRYTGTDRYRDVVENDSRICVAVGDLAELVCHPKKTTATETE